MGFYTLLAAKLVGDAGRVVAFEPVPDNLTSLRRHLALNRVTNVDVVDAAVGEMDSESTFQRGGSSSTGKLADEGAFVCVVHLDGLVEGGLPAPNYVKIDVEGAEFLVLQGAERMLKEFRPTIFLATHGARAHDQCLGLLGRLRYDVSALDGKPIKICEELLAIPRPDERS